MALASFALSTVGRYDGTDGRRHLITRLASVPAFFLFRVVSGLSLLKLSTNYLPVSGFAAFSQFMAFAARLNMVAVGGVQNGLIRQAAAAGDEEALARAQTAAFVIWGISAPLLWLVIAIFSRTISRVLIGTPAQWWAVIAIALIALVAGPGQIWCSILTGRKQVTSSLLAQAAGLLASTTIAGLLITRGDPILATIGFASGSLITMTIAAVRVSRMRMRLAAPGLVAIELRLLLRYSAAFAATTGYSSILLFALRSFYRDHFGTVPLGYWLAANRISAMSTQFLGLFMIQFFVPHLAMLDGETARRAFVTRCWLAGTAIMGSIVLAFAIASQPLVHIFLSNAYMPAIPAIRVYMIGDCLRVWASLAMYSAFARGRPGSYALIEIGTLTMMGALVIAMTMADQVRAPFVGYAGAYAMAAIAISLGFLWRGLPIRPSP